MTSLKRRWLVGMTLTLGMLYLAYLTKTEMGINISSRYSAPDIFKMPLTYLHHWHDLHHG
jgi:hypothetical protein